jgi:catechol 2,3-dioxygenase-like lactoylglutathione lyase family enzyme
MLSYVYFGTNDFDKSIAFYSAILAPLGMERCVTGDPEWDRIAAGWGIYEDGGARELAFWIGKPFNQQDASVGNGSMVAFSARSWNAVDDFHGAALAMAVCATAPRGCGFITRRTFTPPTYAIPMAIRWPLYVVVLRIANRARLRGNESGGRGNAGSGNAGKCHLRNAQSCDYFFRY